MFDKLLGFGASFDWITPLFSVVQDHRNRPSVGYNVPTACGVSAFHIEQRLKQAGIRLWGLMIVGDTITFRVREAQALYTQYWLERDGIPYAGGIEGRISTPQPHAFATNHISDRSSTPSENGSFNSLLGSCLDGIDRVVGK